LYSVRNESLSKMPTNANKDNKNRKHTGDICVIHIYKC
jgi:hypothetical protein